MERPGLIGDMESKSKEQLCEILSRQGKLLNNKHLVQTLPDKGKRIRAFVEKVSRALANKEEAEKKQASLAFARSELQARHQQAFTQHQHVVSPDTFAARTGPEQDMVNAEPLHLVDAASRPDGVNRSESLCIENIDASETTSGDATASGNEDGATDMDFMAAVERLTLSEENIFPPRDTARNPFSALQQQQQQQQKPHYIEVLNKSGKNETTPRLRLNQLPVKSACPPGQFPGSVALISAEARRQRDRKHLDDISAARLPPLHYSHPQLLTLEESVTLLQEQTKKCQELQAKLAAQKLAEGLPVSMNSYHTEGGALATYREVHDDGALSEED